MRSARSLCVVALASLLVPTLTAAHDNAPGVLSLELRDGRYHVVFTRPTDTRDSAAEEVEPRYPPHCVLSGAELDCGDGGLSGPLAFDALEGTRMRIIVVVREDGRVREHVASGEHPVIELSSPPSGVLDWMWLGVEHFGTGLDHLGFLLGLLLLCPLDRRLVLTITAFTAAHSLTLALALLDLLRLPSAPVEACIALSVLLVAREALRPEAQTLTHRAPWLVAALFGLVHGLGFAGALQAVALPSGSLASVLFGFNLGLELGQLAVVFLVVLALVAWRRRWPGGAPRARMLSAYALGALSAFWLIERTVAFWA